MMTPFSVLTHLNRGKAMRYRANGVKVVGWSRYPVAVYMFKTTVESALISLSPMGVRAA